MAKIAVAPLVGAWIEIVIPIVYDPLIMSLPSWERGLKLYSSILFSVSAVVAPLVGAWIEISMEIATTFCLNSRSPRGSVD